MSAARAVELRRAIEGEARRLGFELFGVTTPDPPPHLAVFRSWLEAGRHGEMGYLATGGALERRADPHQILPECRSILALGVRYFAPEERQASAGDWEQAIKGNVASYAWGDDYHTVLAARLAALVDFIEERVGGPVPNRWYTDTGPLLERDLAQRAGLGWIGKNTCLINPEMGSYFLLAEVLLGLELPPDIPFEFDRCSSCTRCLDACPTACILPDRTIDARRCISYLTIEVKGDIPEALRPQIGAWVFGCDICQQVCPWNGRFARPEGDLAFSPRPGVPAPDLCEEMTLTPEQFSQKFKRSPVKRAGRRGYLRNVATALGCSRAPQGDRQGAPQGGPQAVAALTTALQTDTEPLVRAHAAWALGQVGGPEAQSELERAVPNENDPDALRAIQNALERIAKQL